jgi:hypothetical protein
VTGQQWTVVVRDAPLGLGNIVRLEKGVLHRGPRFTGWWWRSNEFKALSKGFDEAHRAEQVAS